MVDAVDRQTKFALLAEACDRLLTDSRAHPSWLATPFLHVISGHPAYLPQYKGVLGGTGDVHWRDRPVSRAVLHLYNLLRGAVGTDSGVHGIYDVLLIGSLVNEDYLGNTGDFYFGNIQQELAARGVRSLLLLRNHTARPASALRCQALRTGVAARAMLSDSLSVREELSLIRGTMAGYLAMQRWVDSRETPFQRQIREACSSQVASPATTASLRLEQQVERICRMTRPRMVMVTYEGYAWERCAWRGARKANAAIVCAGYQHTIMRESSHAMRRSLGPNVDPDILLCIGEFTRDELARERWLAERPVRVLGTHRRDNTITEPLGPVRRTGCLVLPEGIRGEAEILFRFALEAASLLPETKFVLRSHPILSPERILRGLVGKRNLPTNVEVSRGRSLSDDLARSGSMLYRGSSTVLYGILAGLKPFYVDRLAEITLDPLYKLDKWKVKVGSVPEFARAVAADEALSDGSRLAAWQAAARACRRYTVAEQAQCMDWLAEVCHSPRASSEGSFEP